MQAVPKVLEAYKSGEVTLKDFDQFFRNDDTKYSFFQKRSYKGLPTSISDHPKVEILRKDDLNERCLEDDIEHEIVNQLRHQSDKEK